MSKSSMRIPFVWPASPSSAERFIARRVSALTLRGYLQGVVELLNKERFDVLFPAHGQAYLFSRFQDRFSPLTRLALPDFDAFERLQSKVGFARVLAELDLPTPPTMIVKDERALREAARVRPVYVKAAFGTVAQGVFFVRSGDELEQAIEALRPQFDEGIVVQSIAAGRLERMQAVFDRGGLVGFHANRQVERGVGGGDLVKESVRAETARIHMERIGRHLAWHGGLSIDYIVDGQGAPKYIDANRRLAEPGNALASGVNLPGLLVQVSLGRHPLLHTATTPGVCSYMGIQGLLRAASSSGSWRAVARTMIDLACRRGLFA